MNHSESKDHKANDYQRERLSVVCLVGMYRNENGAVLV